jgi:hypothetical protein
MIIESVNNKSPFCDVGGRDKPVMYNIDYVLHFTYECHIATSTNYPWGMVVHSMCLCACVLMLEKERGNVCGLASLLINERVFFC